jgi:NADH dehydrogenase
VFNVPQFVCSTHCRDCQNITRNGDSIRIAQPSYFLTFKEPVLCSHRQEIIFNNQKNTVMKNDKPILVVGATGFLGMEVCRQLSTSNRAVRGLVRSTSDASKIATLHELGVETVEGDVKEISSLRNAMNNVGSIISTASSTLSHNAGDSIETVDKNGQLNVIDAATAAGVEKFVFVSFLPSPESFPLQDAKRVVEQQLKASRMNYTILQPTFFMDIWLSPAIGFDFPHHKATIYGEGKNKISFIAIRDVAAFAVASLNNAEGSNTIIELGGPQALSPLEVVSIFEQKGQAFEVVHVPEEALRSQKNASTDPLQQSFAALMLTFAQGAVVDMNQQFQKFLIQPTSVVDYSKRVMEPVEA